MKLRDTGSGRLPDFFLIGAPKCGTTSLYSWLSAHPDLYMPVKEPGYFSRDIFPIPMNTLDEYRNLFAGAKQGPILVGEATPKYLYSTAGLRELSEVCPRAKLVVLLRNPVDLVVSMHGQMLREGKELNSSFESAWHLAISRRESDDTATDYLEPAVLDYPFWGEIGTRLEMLGKYFPDTQIILFTLDELSSQPSAVYSGVLQFLGVNHDGRTDFPELNKRAAVQNLKLHRLALWLKRRTQHMLEPLQKIRGGKGLGLLMLLNRYNVIRDSYQTSLSSQFREELVNYYSDEISMLEAKTGKDLSSWRQ